MWDFIKLPHRSGVMIVKKNDIHSRPMEVALYQNYPHSFNPSTRICYQLVTPVHGTLMIHNFSGQQLANVVDKFQSAGEHEIAWQPTGLPGA